MRYMGIDFGSKRVGIALSDEGGTMAFPKSVVPNDRSIVDVISSLAAENAVKTIVFGESKNFDGKENLIMESVRKVVDELEGRGFVIVYEPEFLTSHEVSQQRFDMDAIAGRRSDGRAGRKPVSKDAIDASVAALILKNFLERNKK